MKEQPASELVKLRGQISEVENPEIEHSEVAEEFRETNEIISRQSQENPEISTPIMELHSGLLMAQLNGRRDNQSVQQMMELLRQRVVEVNPSVALIDVTGVPNIDAQTAQHLIDSIRTVERLGAKVILTGVRPTIAQMVLRLSVEVPGIKTCSSIAAGLWAALDILELESVRKETR